MPGFASAIFTSVTAAPMPRPWIRPVTAIIGCRLSREISGWPVTGTIAATLLSGNRWPSGARMDRAAKSGCRRPSASGRRTRTPTNLVGCGRLVATAPLMAVESAWVTWSGVMPSRPVRIGSICTSRASPAGFTPLFTSTTPGIFEIAAATRSACGIRVVVSAP